jgi:hypothetical protein
MWSGAGGNGGGGGGGGGGGDDDMYDYDYSVDLNSGNAAPGTSFGYKPPPGTSLGQQQGRLVTGQAGRMMTGQASRMGTSSGGGPGDLRPMTSVSGAGYQVGRLRPSHFLPTACCCRCDCAHHFAPRSNFLLSALVGECSQ